MDLRVKWDKAIQQHSQRNEKKTKRNETKNYRNYSPTIRNTTITTTKIIMLKTMLVTHNRPEKSHLSSRILTNTNKMDFVIKS